MSDAPQITVRPATIDDVDVLSDLYRLLEAEMIALEEMWPLADGLPEPVADALAAEIDDEDSVFLVGLVDGYPFGFLIARVEDLLPQASGEQIGAIRYVFVDQGARQISVGEHLLESALAALRERGVHRFDAHVLPGHRLVKNFFESGGFSARSIVMHNGGD
jgi:GNAT superfamily N-acetyltransferase